MPPAASTSRLGPAPWVADNESAMPAVLIGYTGLPRPDHRQPEVDAIVAKLERRAGTNRPEVTGTQWWTLTPGAHPERARAVRPPSGQRVCRV